jgi:asparagine synthase (glutamine-hydrolysing)
VGERCVERFNGMWAFALWDGPRRWLFASRDRFA